jgi:hypothetical protein
VLVEEVLSRVVGDESAHAQLGWWFLDWAEPRLDESTRDHLGTVAGATLRAFAPVLGGSCAGSGLGVVGCDVYDAALAEAAARHVARPLAARGIHVPADDLAAIGALRR